MKKSFKVIQSNPNQKGGFVTKIQTSTSVETPFGVKEAKLTYYVSGTLQLEADTIVELDMSQWIISEHPMINPNTGESFQAKWLHVKA